MQAFPPVRDPGSQLPAPSSLLPAPSSQLPVTACASVRARAVCETVGCALGCAWVVLCINSCCCRAMRHTLTTAAQSFEILRVQSPHTLRAALLLLAPRATRLGRAGHGYCAVIQSQCSIVWLPQALKAFQWFPSFSSSCHFGESASQPYRRGLLRR